MAFKFQFVILAAWLALSNAGLIGSPVATTYSAGIAGPLLHAAPAPLLRAAPLGLPAPLLRAAPLVHAPVLRSAQIALPAPAIARVAAPLAVAAPVAKTVVAAEEYDPNPQYSYGYDVQDGLTGDNKNQFESRNGDVVQGSYSLNDADGTRRTVEYTADPINGFNAVVHKEPLVAKAVVAAPAFAKVAAPVAYAAPAHIASPLAYSPVAKVAAPLAYSTSVLH